MSNGETITITITGNPKSGKTTLAILIETYLISLGVKADYEDDIMPPEIDRSNYAQDNINRIVGRNLRVVIEEKFYPPSDDRVPVDAVVHLSGDGTYKIKRRR